MTLSEEQLRTLWQERSASVPSDRSTCLTDVEWARLLSKEAATTERARAADHISSCTACADEYRLLKPLQSWVTDVERVLSSGDAAHANRWTSWRAWLSPPRLAFAVAAATLLLVTQAVMLSRLVESTRETAQLEGQLAQHETALAATQTALSVLQDEQRRNSEAQAELQKRLATPQLDIPIVELEPQPGGTVRGADDRAIVTTTPDAPTVTLVLNLPPIVSRSTFEVEVADKGGQVRWTGRTSRDQDGAALTLSLPAAGYPPGEYVVRLFDVTRGRTALAAYSVVIRHRIEGNR